MAVTNGRGDAADTVPASTSAASDEHAPEEGALVTDAAETGTAASEGAGEHTAGAPPAGAAHATRGRAGQIMLREVDPADDAVDTPPSRESSTVTTSLLAAFAARSGGATRPTGTTTAVRGAGDGVVADRAPSTTGDGTSDTTLDTPDGTDDTLVDAPDTARDGTDDTSDAPDDTPDTPRDTAADTPVTAADTDEIASDGPADGGPQIVAADTTDPAAGGGAGRFANLPTVPIAASAAAAAVGRPADRAMPDDASSTSDDRDDARDGEDDGGEAGGASPGMDPWTTVAQVTLLFIGVLAVIQTVVLVIVNQFLTQSTTGVGREAADVLAAHGKVTTVMLPALIGGAIAAVALAVWRIRTVVPPAAGDQRPPGRRALGVPVPLWVAAATTAGVLGVVLAGSSASIAAAQRTTMAAITTCLALALAFLFAPRSLAVPEDEDDAPDDHAANDPSASPGPLVGVG